MKGLRGALMFVALAVVLVAAGFLAGGRVLQQAPESSDSKVISAVERAEEVVLVSLGIQGIVQESNETKIFGVRVPGTGRNVLLQYGYSAKLGIDGADVEIRATGENTYVVTIPAFEFIGHDDVTFQTVHEENGLLSWTNAEIDESAVISQILDAEAMAAHVAQNRDLLRSQAQSFYTDIIKAVEPRAEITFLFVDDAPQTGSLGN